MKNTRIYNMAKITRNLVDTSLREEKLDSYEAFLTIEIATACNVLSLLFDKFEDIIELFDGDIERQTTLQTWYNNQFLKIEELKENEEKEGK